MTAGEIKDLIDRQEKRRMALAQRGVTVPAYLVQSAPQSAAIFEIVDGPDGDSLYTAKRVSAVDFGPIGALEVANVGETEYKIRMIGVIGILPSAAPVTPGPQGPFNGYLILAFFVGMNPDGVPIWVTFQGMPGDYNLVLEPDPEVVCGG